MNFFEQQDRARSKTSWLVVFLVLAVAGLVVITTLAVALFVYVLQNGSGSYSAQGSAAPLSELGTLLTPELVGTVAVVVLVVVICASLFKLLELSRGGKQVAEALGGRLLNTDTRDADERKILNVVEEMAIASGNPVPSVYLLEEPGINAFAAGLGRHDAVIGITRGCIQALSRDELQGVVAHEFSHIHFGDMRLNLRLVALLHGILVIGLIGYFLLRSAGLSRRKNAGAQLGLGLALVIIGYCGTFFGSLIKAAVSRQREFLADASAVQFTRNPAGIANALKKIGGAQAGSRLENAHASEYSHLYFANGVSRALASVFATHPPLKERISRIEPQWDGQYLLQARPEPSSASGQAAAASLDAGVNREKTFSAVAAVGAVSVVTQQAQTEPASLPVEEAVGNPTPEHIDYAHQWLAALPVILREAAHEPYSARALIYALLLDAADATRELQMQHLREKAHPATFKLVDQLYLAIRPLPRTAHLPLLELSIPALKQMSKAQYSVFKSNLAALIRADKKVSLFEWSLYRTLTHSVEEIQRQGKRHLKDLHAECQLLLSVICYSGKNAQPSHAFQAGVKALQDSAPYEAAYVLVAPSAIEFKDVDRALDRLADLAPLEKPRLLKALQACVQADGKVHAEEAEIYRAVADSLDCPVPPLLAT